MDDEVKRRYRKVAARNRNILGRNPTHVTVVLDLLFAPEVMSTWLPILPINEDQK